jgi:Uma2 family endonuclease
MAILQREMTLDQFLALPELKPALEYQAGKVTQKVSPKAPHGKLQATVARLFDNFAEPIRLASAFTETRTTFGGNSLVPDVSLYRWDRIPLDSNGRVIDDFTTPPDIAVEILSPGQSLREAISRCGWYVRNGVEIALLVNPRDDSDRLFRSGAEPELLTGADRIELDSVLPGFRLTVQDLFDALRLRQ